MGLFGLDFNSAKQSTEGYQSGADHGASAVSGRVGKGGSFAANGGISIVQTQKKQKNGGKKNKNKNGTSSDTDTGGNIGITNNYTTRTDSPEAIAANRDITLAALDAVTYAAHDLAELSHHTLQAGEDFAALSIPTQAALDVVDRPNQIGYDPSGDLATVANAGGDVAPENSGNQNNVRLLLLVVAVVGGIILLKD
jgi:hypothetical protein